MDIRKKFNEFRALQRKLHAYSHVLNLLYLDAVTAAPSGATAGRGETMEFFNRDVYELSAGERTKELIAALKENKSALTECEQRELAVFSEELDYLSCIPMDEYVAYQNMLNEAEAAWHKAKIENDFPAFAPYLEEIFSTTKRFSLYYKPNVNPYDVRLSMFERGLDRKTADSFFSALRTELVPLIAQTQEREQVRSDFLFRAYPIEAQRRFSEKLMRALTIDPAHCAIAETEHPFTLEFNKKDVRITTHYHEKDVASSMYSVIHEGGHALYELGSGDEYEYTALAGGVSMGIHESQSRLFENMIGRSREFIHYLFPTMLELFPTQLADVSAEDFYRAVNRAEPSLIRTEADELTYSLHVMVRYELEKAVMAGDLSVRELPLAWHDLMKSYLGVEVPDDTRGVLQDSHWSGGSIGYFPSYALGSAYSAQIMARMKREIPVKDLLSRGELAPITGWLGEHLFRHGKRYEPKELLLRVTGEEFSPQYYTDYLREKFADIYCL